MSAICLPKIPLIPDLSIVVDGEDLSVVNRTKNQSRNCCRGGILSNYSFFLSGNKIWESGFKESSDQPPFPYAVGDNDSFIVPDFNANLIQLILDQVGLQSLPANETVQVYVQLKNCEDAYTNKILVATTISDYLANAWRTNDTVQLWTTGDGKTWLIGGDYSEFL